MIMQSTHNYDHKHTHDHNHDYEHNVVPTDDCFVDTDAFNQLLQCCFDPSHLDNSNLPKTRSMSMNSFNNLNVHNLDPNIELPSLNKSELSSTIENSSVLSNNSPYLSSNFLDSCTPIDLNPCCITDNHLNNAELSASHIHASDCHHIDNHSQNEMDLSEMVILNNFFSACCDDSNVQLDSKFPDINPPISTPALTSYSNSYPNNDNNNNNNSISSLRDSLKANQSGTNHHHHLLHLHHHNSNDTSKSHTHDIIFHHHNAHTCSHAHNNHVNHHHHLHFEDKINGQKVKHDFILPDCDIIPKNSNPNSTSNLNNNKSIINSDKCTDFITASICKTEKTHNKPASSSICDHLHNVRLPTQQGNQQQPHHCYLQHHCNSNNLLHQQHFHKTPNIEHPINHIKTEGQNNNNDDNFTLSSNDSNMSLKCKWNNCNEELDPLDLEKHIFEHHLQNLPMSPSYQPQSLRCEWEDCDFLANNINNFLEHMPMHTYLIEEDSLNTDNNSSNTNTDINTNTNTNGDSNNNNNENIHRCKWIDPKTGVRCDKIFSKTDDLTDHLIEEHIKSGKSSYLCHWEDCNRCGKPFTQRQKIIRHLNTHTNHRPFECQICHKKFSLDLMLKQHMRIHTGEKPYECKQCGKTFKTSSSLTIHLRTHSGDRPMECKICGKRFNESSNLNKHMKIHFRQYKCQHCLKSFDSQAKFDRHQALCKNKPLV